MGENDYALISELCNQNIQQFFICYKCLFAKISKNKIFGSGYNRYGQLARGYANPNLEHLKPEIIEFFNDKNIIDISIGVSNFNKSKRGSVSQIKRMNAFEYCLLGYQETFTTIHFNGNIIYYENLIFNENSQENYYNQ